MIDAKKLLDLLREVVERVPDAKLGELRDDVIAVYDCTGIKVVAFIDLDTETVEWREET